MTSKEKIKYRNKWKKHINIIRNDMEDLLLSRKIFWEIDEIIEKNDKLKKTPGLFFEWIKDNYVARMTIAIRRLADTHEGTISLPNLIDDLKTHPEALNRKYFTSKYSKKAHEYGRADFDFNLFANKSQDNFSDNKLKIDTNKIIKSTKRLKKFVNKWIAHYDVRRKKKVKKLPTFDDLNSILTDLDKTTCKYYMLLTRGGMRTCEPVLQYDWKEPLRIAWIA